MSHIFLQEGVGGEGGGGGLLLDSTGTRKHIQTREVCMGACPSVFRWLMVGFGGGLVLKWFSERLGVGELGSLEGMKLPSSLCFL